jgi:type I restriction enzyme, S subunit
MTSEWREISLKEAVQFIVDNRGKTAPTVENGIALIATNCVNNKDLYPQKLNLRYVSQDTYENWFRSHPKAGDILLTNKGSQNGAICLVPDPVDFCIAQDMVALRADPEKIDPLYLFAALRSEVVQQRIKALNVDAVIPHLKKTDFDKLFIPLPDALTQKWIGEWHFQLCSRIELLRETNNTLEAIAQALFKSWFVDFDPVHVKMQGRDPEGMDEATAALFPDSFEESELGPVPKGWQIGSVEDLCSTITNGGTPSRSKPVFWEGGSIPWFKTGEFHDGFLLKASEFITNDALNGSSVKLLPKDAVLMAIYAAPTVGRLGILTEPATFNQACTGMVAKADIGPWFLFWTLFNGRVWFNSRANGAAQQNISKAIVSAYRVVVPKVSILAAFNNSASSLHDAIRMNSEKALTLSELRDTLLPRLISGQISLPEVGQLEEFLA